MPDEFVDLEYDLRRVEASRGVLELAVRQLRAFAKCVTANRIEADELVEDALMLFLAEDRILRECDACFAELVEVFRRVHARVALIQVSRTSPDKEYAALIHLSLPEREVAALVMGAGMSLPQAAGLLGLPLIDIEVLLQCARSKLGTASLPEWPLMQGAMGGYQSFEDDGIE